MLNVNIICVGTLKERYFREAAAEYEKRLGAFCRIKTAETTDQKLSALLGSQKGYKIALCVEGKQLSSEELAQKIDQLPTAGYSEVSFLIGGFDGLCEEIKAMCDFRLSFSKMTFPHRLMHIMLLEQIYRAFTINANQNYHH